MNYYQHHIGDFIRDTARLSDSQCMAYMRMLWVYYETEQPLENDADALAFKIGANASDVHQILKHFFFLHDDNLWHQARCDKEILGFRGKSEKAKNSANARWNNANAMRAHSERNANEPVFDANQEPVTSNQEPLKSKALPPNPLPGEEPAKPSRRFDPIQACPANVSPGVWQDWVTCRKEMRKPLSETTCKAQAKQLENHPNPDQVILESISAGWQGLFPDRVSNVLPMRSGKIGRPALKPGEWYHPDWNDKDPSTHTICTDETHQRDTGYAWKWLKQQSWYRP
jgi:uncharacterized protein YdaU (DUF1376 family)